MEEKKVLKKVFETHSGGRLKIHNTEKFLKLLSGADPEVYEKLLIFGRKNLNQKAADIPYQDREMIINFAISKALASYDSSFGANFLTYFTNKLRGEVTDYRSKRDSMMTKVRKYAEANAEMFQKTFDHNTMQNKVEKVDMESTEDKILAEDIYRRKLQAFRMAFSGIPYESQYILNRIVQDRASLQSLANEYGLTLQDLTRMRNHALSLIFSRVLRSPHLDEEEKDEVRREHGLLKKDS